MLAATTRDGRVPGGITPAAKSASVAPVPIRPPTTCRKNAGSPHRFSSLPSRSMSPVTRNAASAVIGAAPRRSATDAASPAQPAVATHRGYGCGALTASESAADAASMSSSARSTRLTISATSSSRVRSSAR
jgi:hypothetical protein